VRKELNECLIWLRLLEKRGMAQAGTVRAAYSECDELCRIISASRKMAEKRLKKERVSHKEF
jgi:four helix bundle protein